jgi:hypothetical protein
VSQAITGISGPHLVLPKLACSQDSAQWGLWCGALTLTSRNPSVLEEPLVQWPGGASPADVAVPTVRPVAGWCDRPAPLSGRSLVRGPGRRLGPPLLALCRRSAEIICQRKVGWKICFPADLTKGSFELVGKEEDYLVQRVERNVDATTRCSELQGGFYVAMLLCGYPLCGFVAIIYVAVWLCGYLAIIYVAMWLCGYHLCGCVADNKRRQCGGRLSI